MRKTIKLGTLIFFALVLAICIPQNVLGAQLNLVLTTDKLSYGPGASVVINGNLTLDNNPVSNGVIGIQVNDPQGRLSIIRTVPTGNNVTNTWPIQILNVVPIGNLYGAPSYSFKRGSYVGFNVTISNNYASSRAVMITVNVLDSSNVPICGATIFNGTIQAGDVKNAFSYPVLQIPIDAPLGTAMVYVNVWNAKLPSNNGFALAQEITTTFTVVSGTLSTTLNSAPAGYSTLTIGTGSLSFKIPSSNARLGNYTVCGTAVYYVGIFPYYAASSLRFSVVLIGDLNGDGKVDIRDIAITAKAYGSSPGMPNWNPIADLNGDGKVDIRDIAIVAKNYGVSGTY
jgi:hypothetical protein